MHLCFIDVVCVCLLDWRYYIIWIPPQQQQQLIRVCLIASCVDRFSLVLRWQIRPHVCIRYLCRCSECVLHKYSSTIHDHRRQPTFKRNDPNTTVIAFPRRKKKIQKHQTNIFVQTFKQYRIVACSAQFMILFLSCKSLHDKSFPLWRKYTLIRL